MKVVVAGGTGFVGTRLIAQLIAMGDTVTLLTRGWQAPANRPGQAAIQIWDGKSQGDWAKVIDGADVVINLCGESIANRRWDENQKKLMRASRLDSTQAIVEAIRSAKVKPQILVNASAVGYYGSVPEGEVSEQTQKGNGFLPDLCADWEAAALLAEKMGVRVVLPRMGIILGAESGALKKMIPAFKYFVGGFPGSGQQWFPWVHVQDVVSLILFAVKNKEVTGAFNACSPQPARMVDFCRILGKVLNRPSLLAVPEFALKYLLGEMAEIVLGGQRALPRKMLDLGFKFRYAALESALISILTSNR